MPGGFIGVGAKTVIPAVAVAKVSLRLVPDMTPGDSFAKLKGYVEAIVPKGVTVGGEVDSLGRAVCGEYG